MKETIIELQQHEKLDLLLRSFLRYPKGSIRLDRFQNEFIEIAGADLFNLEEKLLDDGLLCYKVGPSGLEISLTDCGTEFIVYGGYSRVWEPSLNSKSPGSRKILGFLMIGIIYIALLVAICLSLKK